jgi:hypothetical protein
LTAIFPEAKLSVEPVVFVSTVSALLISYLPRPLLVILNISADHFLVSVKRIGQVATT